MTVAMEMDTSKSKLMHLVKKVAHSSGKQGEAVASDGKQVDILQTDENDCGTVP